MVFLMPSLLAHPLGLVLSGHRWSEYNRPSNSGEWEVLPEKIFK